VRPAANAKETASPFDPLEASSFAERFRERDLFVIAASGIRRDQQ